MLCAHEMPRPNDAELQERERGFSSVRIDVTVYINAVLVANRLMLGHYASEMQVLRLRPAWRDSAQDDRFVLQRISETGPKESRPAPSGRRGADEAQTALPQGCGR
jgi:hypothetical protein